MKCWNSISIISIYWNDWNLLIISKQFNPDLNIAKLDLEQAIKDVAIARSDLSPSATLSFQVTQTDDVSSTYKESDKEKLDNKENNFED